MMFTDTENQRSAVVVLVLYTDEMIKLSDTSVNKLSFCNAKASNLQYRHITGAAIGKDRADTLAAHRGTQIASKAKDHQA